MDRGLRPGTAAGRWLVAKDPGGRVTGCADMGLLIESTESEQGFLHTAVHPDSLGDGERAPRWPPRARGICGS